MTSEQIFKTIAKTMKNLNKTPASIAKELDKHPSTIRRWLKQEGKIKISKLFLLLHSLGLTLKLQIRKNK